MGIRSIKSESGLTTVEILVILVLMVVLLGGGLLAGTWMKNSITEKAAPASIERTASQIDEEAEGLSGETLLKSVYTERPGLDNSTMDVSFNDSETKALTAKLSIPASSDYSSKVEGTVDDYTITYTGKDVEFTYDSTTGEITKEERG